jgi:hypothetical protein
MLRCVGLVRTDVSEDLSPSIIRVTRLGELGTPVLVTVMMEGLSSFETPVCHVRFEISTAVTMKNDVFWNIETQFATHMKHITSPLQNPVG